VATGVIEQVPSRNLSLIGTDQERLRALFDGLAVDGTTVPPPSPRRP